MDQTTAINIGKLQAPKRKASYHVPSTVQPDTLFHFVSKPDYLIDVLKLRMIAPRYCKEDLRYLGLDSVKELAFPMSCFCDIGLQRLGQHMDCYGYYGIAFPKKWCMENGFQAVQYLNRDTPLSKDIRKAFRAAMRAIENTSRRSEDALPDYLLHQMMYYKPYQGNMRFRVDGRVHRKCFADECEWRLIPNLDSLDMPMVIGDSWHMDKYLRAYNDVLHGSEASLKFDYDDVKYIMVRDPSGYAGLMKEVESWRKAGQVTHREAYAILSKVLVWEEIKGDF